MKYLKRLNEENITFNTKDTIMLYIFLFMICSIIGWIYEELYFIIDHHGITNRGFLYGPYLPVYGWGCVLIVLLLRQYKKHPTVIFFLSAILTGVLEYITGSVMYKIWHHHWWNYKGRLLNINGHVCLESVLFFGFGSLIIIYIVDPLLRRYLKKLTKKEKQILTISMLIIYIIDNILTFLIRYKL